MKPKRKQDRTLLLDTARAVTEELNLRSEGTRLTIRSPHQTVAMNTDGWRAIIGRLGKNQPRLEVWFDRFSGYPQRKFYAGFCSEDQRQIISIAKRVERRLWPVRIVNINDVDTEKFVVLVKRLTRSEFNTPVLEKYQGGYCFYGIYDPTRETSERVNRHFCERAVAFFEDVARALPHATSEDEHHEVYPRIENRKHVTSHIHRERSGLLAVECKNRDEYKCQVCGFRFEDLYGNNLGLGFAEAHHLVPLSKLRDAVRTQLADLTTVCANCHRMLHRMDGERGDKAKLRTIVRRHQKK